MSFGQKVTWTQIGDALDLPGWNLSIIAGADKLETLAGPQMRAAVGSQIWADQIAVGWLSPYWRLEVSFCNGDVLIFDNPGLLHEDDMRREELGGKHMSDAALDSMRGILG